MLYSTGCSKQNPPRLEVSHVYLEEREIQRFFTEDGLLLETYDINRDGAIDNFAFSQPLSRHGDELTLEELDEFTPDTLPNFRLVRRELDMNFDGNIDFVRHYDGRGQVTKDEVDTDYDGGFDRIVHYNNGLISRREIDADGDGYFEEVRYFIKGQIFRIEKDTTNSGQANYWQFFEEGQLVRAGFDHDGDRVIDEWQLAEQLAGAQKAVERDEAEQLSLDEDEP